MTRRTLAIGSIAALLVFAGTYGGYVVGYRSGERSTAERLSPMVEVVPAPVVEPKPVAIVGGVPITGEELLVRVAGLPSVQGTLDRMIDEKVVELAAQREGVAVTEADVDAEIKRIESQVGGPIRLRTTMTQYSYTMESLRADQRMRLQQRQMLGSKIPITDDVLRQFFLEAFDRFDKREVHTRHILVKTEQEAQAIRAQLMAGADFEALARKHSIDPAIKQNGGDYGFNRRGAMVPEYEEVAFELAVGAISEPVRSPYGFHIIQVQGKRGVAPSYEEAKAEVRQRYMDEQVYERTQPWLAKQRASMEITRLLN